MKNILVFLMLSVLAIGCATSLDYRPPNNILPQKNSVEINKSKDELWKQIVPALGKNFFVINNLDKESGIINISYSGDPEKYIDCGHIKSSTNTLSGEWTDSFSAASANQDYAINVIDMRGRLFINRKMTLEGRMNIIVEEIDSNKSIVTVSTKYILTKSGTIKDGRGGSQSFSDTISFNTNQGQQFPGMETEPNTFCQANGDFEKEILSLLLNQ